MKRRDFLRALEGELDSCISAINRPALPPRKYKADRGENIQRRVECLKGHIQDLAHTRRAIIPPNDYCEPREIPKEDKQIMRELYAAARMLAIPAEEIKITGNYLSVLTLTSDIRLYIKYQLFDREAEIREAESKAQGRSIAKPNN